MATQDLGEIQEVNVRDIWPHEAHNFTAWLSEPKNLQLLGDALGLTLEFVGREVPVGNFKLDILARETDDDALVAIENQLNSTDHSHLGQAITYAADKDAKYVIWIASTFGPEHRTAVGWLNSLAPEAVWFYAVEVHAIKIDDSLPAPTFRPVAVPKKWNGSVSPSLVEAPSPDVIRLREFFAPLVADLENAGFGPAEADMQDTQYWFLHGHQGVWYVVGLDDEGAWVCLWFWEELDFGQRLYHSLKEQQEEIAAEIGSPLDWFDGNLSNGLNVSLIRGGSINDPQPALDEIRAWMLETLPKFRDVFNPRLEKILTELENG